MSQQAPEEGMKQITVAFDGRCFTLCPLTLGAANELLRGFEEGEVSASFGIDTPAIIPATADEFICAPCIRTDDSHARLLKKLNAYFGISLPGLETDWKVTCIRKN